jgi:[ribosomal protein S18]-alanine N-acetyltransferase
MIRPLELDDIKMVVDDEMRIFGETLGEEMFKSSINGSEPFNHFFVDTADSKIRGYIGIWFDGGNAQILNLYVNEDYRRQHIGEGLMRFAIDYLWQNNVTTISLEVRPHNLDAVDLYRKLGFEYSYKRKFYYNDGEDAHVYILYKEM